jgi:DMSO/TMAO reductase YedYZ molybdopterin-dependent catalytic subunit
MDTAPTQTFAVPRLPSARLSWVASLVIAVTATIASMATMFWLRTAYQIRTLPERVMEWVLLFVSPDTLEQGLSQFGAQAKVYALYVAVAGMALILLALGTMLVRLVRSPWALLASGPVLFLVAMAVIMPVTGGGLFGLDLLQDWRLVNAGYLVVALTYAGVLATGRWAAVGPNGATTVGGRPADNGVSRRAALVSLGSMAVAAISTFWLGQRGGASASSLPLAQVQLTPRADTGAAPPTALPRPGAPAAAALAPATALPRPAPPAVAQGQPAEVAKAVATPATVSQAATPVPPTPVPPTLAPTSAPVAAAAPPQLPRPAVLSKQLVRDQDGSTTAGARQPGTLAPLITSTADHYHVTKNPVSDPVIAPETWSLALDGEVNSPVRLDYGTLRQLPTVELAKTLECVSNLTDKCELVPFGCELIGTASWKGVRLVDILELAGGLKSGVVAVAMIGEDEFISSVPPEAVLDPATIVAYEMNGAVLPYEHGYPARVLLPGRYGYKSPKWIRVIRPSTRPVVDWYGQRNWNKDGIVRTMTRIDVPAPAATLPAGQQRIAGIAYASNRGISKVEYSADGGYIWSVATMLEPQPGPDAWVRWEGAFDLPAGAKVELISRATDGQGVLQQETFSLAQPDGGAGWHHNTVTGA